MIDEEKIFAEAREEELTPETKTSTQRQIVHSQFNQEYRQILGDCIFTESQIFRITKTLYEKQKIYYIPHTFEESIKIQVLYHSRSYRALLLNVRFGYFQCNLSILFEKKQSMSHHCQAKSSYNFRSIYITQFQPQQAIKCFQFNQFEAPYQIFGSIIKEYCFLKLASGLGVGPSLHQITGFDITVYQNCIEFQMEKCLEAKDDKLQISQIHFDGLKRKLSLLHYFKIIHLDIKPANIVYSRMKSSFVFIDYGFSRCIKETKGNKSKTYFAGSLGYCSLDMKKLFSSDNVNDYIDLYHNDAYSLKSSIRQILSKSKVVIEDKKNEEEQVSWNKLIKTIPTSVNEELIYQFKQQKYQEEKNIISIKFNIFFRNQFILSDSINRDLLLKYSTEFLQFIAEFPYSQALIVIHNFIVSNCPFIKSKDEANRFDNIQYKKQKIFYPQKDHSQSESTTNLLFQKLNINQNDSAINLSPIDKVILLVIKKNEKQILTDQKQLRTMNKDEYYKLFMKIVDLRASFTSILEKEKISSIFIRVENVKQDDYQIKTEFKQLQLSMKFILKQYLKSLNYYFETIIPYSIINLVIIEALSPQQLQKIYQSLLALVGGSQNTYNSAFMLFRLNFISDWMKFKVISIYNEVTDIRSLKIFLAKALFKISKAEAYQFVEIIQKLIYSQINILKIRPQFAQHMCLFIKNSGQISAEMNQQLFSCIMIKLEKQSDQNSRLLDIKTMVRLYQTGTYLLNKNDQFNYIHLRFFNDLQFSSSNTSILSNIYTAATHCLQHINIIGKFKFFYSSQGFHKYKETVKDRLDFLMKLCQTRQNLYKKQILTEFYRIILNIFQSEKAEPQKFSQYQEIIRKLKLIFCDQFLLKMPFGSIEVCQKISHFYYKANLISFLYLRLYHNEIYLALDMIDEFYAKLFQFLEKIRCTDCKNISYNSLIQLKTFLLRKRRKYEDAIQVCVYELENIKYQEKSQAYINCVQTLLEQMIFIIHDSNNNDLKRNFSENIYRTMKQKDLFHTVFIQKNGYEIYYFISNFLLETEEETIKFVQFHQILLFFINHFPSKEFTHFYKNSLDHFIKKKPQLIAKKCSSIIDAYFNWPKNQSTFYGGIFISSFLKIISQKHLYKSILTLCIDAENISIEAKNIILNCLFSYIFSFQVMNFTAREKRRKIIKHCKYLKTSCKFKCFINQLDLKELSKRSKKSIFLQFIEAKIMKLFLILQF